MSIYDDYDAAKAKLEAEFYFDLLGDRIATNRLGERKAIILLNYKTFFLNFTAQNISS